MPQGVWILENSIMHYAWGTKDAIPKLLGGAPSTQPCAELWIGAHPTSPSTFQGRPLGEIVAEDPDGILGPGLSALPFLFKVLSAASPLSIQCHPNKAQAEEGFARENAAGIPLDAPHRNYRDSNHKPELIVALTPFVALKGFRPLEHIQGAFENIGSEAPDSLASIFSALDQDALRRAVAWAQDDGSPEACEVRDLAARYPGDVGALAPLFLNLVELAPGQGLYLGARELHSYLRGTGIEVMANSDNVLRGGLTPKHVDVDELMKVLAFEPGDATPLLGPVYQTPAKEFALMRGDEPLARTNRRGVELVFCSDATCSVAGAELRRGQAALIPYRTGDYEITGTYWLVTVP